MAALFTAQAELDLEEIADYIALDNPKRQLVISPGGPNRRIHLQNALSPGNRRGVRREHRVADIDLPRMDQRFAVESVPECLTALCLESRLVIECVVDAVEDTERMRSV